MLRLRLRGWPVNIFDPMFQPAWWGFGGALAYASMKVTACVYDASPEHGPRSKCFVEAAVALLVGTIAAASFEPWLAGYILHSTAPQETRAMSAVIGLLANQTAPGIISFLGETLLTRIKGGH